MMYRTTTDDALTVPILRKPMRPGTVAERASLIVRWDTTAGCEPIVSHVVRALPHRTVAQRRTVTR